MIKVKVEKDKITITGHANYAEYGSDIVCASVSATIMTSIEGNRGELTNRMQVR